MRRIIVISLFISCGVRHDRHIRVTELGWTFELPASITFKDSAFDSNGNIIVASWDSTPGKRRLLLFNIQPKENNHLNCIIFVDSSNYSAWEKATISAGKVFFDLSASLPNYKILDTSLTTYKIDGVDFQKQYLKCFNKDSKDTLWSFRFSRLFKNYDININIYFTDQDLGRTYLKIIDESKFEN